MARKDTYNDGETHQYCMTHCGMKATRRVSNSSFDGESCIFIEALDVALGVVHGVEEYEHGLRPTLWSSHTTGIREEDDEVVPIVGFSDSRDWTDACKSLVYKQGLEKRRKADVADVQELQALGRLDDVRKIDGKFNPVDAGTKKKHYDSPEMQRLRDLAQGRFIPYPSGCVRK